MKRKRPPPSSTAVALSIGAAVVFLLGRASHQHLDLSSFSLSSPEESLQHARAIKPAAASPAVAFSYPPSYSVNAWSACPELIAGARYVSDLARGGPQLLPSWNVRAVYLEGRWDGEHHPPSVRKTMRKVGRHNARVLRSQGIGDVVAARSPVSINATNEERLGRRSPAFWKMGLMRHHCRHPAPSADLLLFLDGDLLVMDPLARVEFLWALHSLAARAFPTYGTGRDQPYNVEAHSLDMLFAYDWNGYNSGVILVNCTSPTALRFLQVWEDVALDLFERDVPLILPDWEEQNALHYILQTERWRHGLWGDAPNNRTWDVHLAEYGLDASLYSTAALRSRVRHTWHQCALNSQPIESEHARAQVSNDSNVLYHPGTFVIHMAGVADKFELLERYMAQRERYFGGSMSEPLSLQQAAMAYLATRQFDQ